MIWKEEDQKIPVNRKDWIITRLNSKMAKRNGSDMIEGAILYSMGIHSFMDLANEAKAVYRIKRICLVNTEKLDEYIEVMYGDPESN